MSSRIYARTITAFIGLWRQIWLKKIKVDDQQIKKIIILQELFLGDAIMLTPLLAHTRKKFPTAQIILTLTSNLIPLFKTKPFGVEVIEINFRQPFRIINIIKSGGYDLAIIPAENRLSWLARAAKASWIVAFDQQTGFYKNFPIDEFVSFSKVQKAGGSWGDWVVGLIGEKSNLKFNSNYWQQPAFKNFDIPKNKYIHLHIGASNPTRYWPKKNWHQVINWIINNKFNVAITFGADQKELLPKFSQKEADEIFIYRDLLDLSQIWQLIKKAKLLVCTDTGILHLAHLVGTPTISIFGPGNPQICGRGKYWQDHKEIELFQDDINCRNQNLVFNGRNVNKNFCIRKFDECPKHICMKAINYQSVIEAAKSLIK